MKDRRKTKTAMSNIGSQSSSTTITPRDVQQAGAICYRLTASGRLQVLLVGSRRNGRWGVPKGHIDPGEASHAAAARESFEEAGVVGDVGKTIFGFFGYQKDSSPHRYHVAIHLLRVTKTTDEFPEKAVRKQKWFSIKDAILEAAQPGLRSLLDRLEPELI